MGAGQFFRNMGDRIQRAPADLDAALIRQADMRAEEARQAAIESIKSEMIRNPSDQGVQQQMQAQGYTQRQMDRMVADPTNERYGPDFDEMAYGQMSGNAGFVERVNRAMVNDPAARYGYSALAVGGATAGGAAMTAGAQKLIGLMGILGEAEETEVARDLPLTS